MPVETYYFITNYDLYTIQQSQKEQKKDMQIKYGKLPMIPIINLECQSKADSPVFRGDRGSIFLVNCPAKCLNSQGIVYGTNIYSTQSSICRAAIHAGILTDDGGLALLINQLPNKIYNPSENQLLLSMALNDGSKAFSISKANSIAKQLSQLYEIKYSAI